MACHWPSSRLIINIKDLLNVHRVESQRVEFKRSWNLGGTSWQVLHTICAFGNDFLNDDGGYIVIGVEDKPSEDGKVQVCGVPAQDLDKIQNQINGQCKGNIKPCSYRPILSPEVYDEKHVLVIWAPPSESGALECRVSARSKKGSKEESKEESKEGFKHYIRCGAQTKVASEEETVQLRDQHTKTPFDHRSARDFGKTSS